MPSKTTKPAKVQTLYALAIYGSIIKSGTCVVRFTHEDPEEVVNSLKEFYGDDIKARYVKCNKALDTVQAAFLKELDDGVKLNDTLFKQSVTEIIKALKTVTEAKKCSTIQIYSEKNEEEAEEDAEEESEDEPPAKAPAKKAAKKVETDDEVEVAAPKKKGAKKVAAVESEPEDEPAPKKAEKKVASTKKSEAKSEAKSVAKKTKAKTTKTSIVLSDEDEDEDDEEEAS